MGQNPPPVSCFHIVRPCRLPVSLMLVPSDNFNEAAKINKLPVSIHIYCMQVPDIRKVSIDKVKDPLLVKRILELDVLRLDKIHPVISGNKWFKLKYHLDNFNAGNYKGILTFGGAWSNHIAATASACHLLNVNCVGIIRGEKPPQFSKTLSEAMDNKMELKFIDRQSYQQKDSPGFIDQIKKEFPGYYFIPEGGAGHEGEKGAAEIM